MNSNIDYRLKTKKLNNDSRYEILCSVDNGQSWEPVVFCLHCYYSKPKNKLNDLFYNGSKILIPREGIINQTFICKKCEDYHQELFSNLKNKNKKDKKISEQQESSFSLVYISNNYPGVSRLMKKITKLGFKYPSEIMTISTIGFIFGKLLK